MNWGMCHFKNMDDAAPMILTFLTLQIHWRQELHIKNMREYALDLQIPFHPNIGSSFRKLTADYEYPKFLSLKKKTGRRMPEQHSG